jgi:hypothetical protein
LAQLIDLADIIERLPTTFPTSLAFRFDQQTIQPFSRIPASECELVTLASEKRSQGAFHFRVTHRQIETQSANRIAA